MQNEPVFSEENIALGIKNRKAKPVAEDDEMLRERTLELERTREAWILRQVDNGISRGVAEGILNEREKTKARRALQKEQDMEMEL